MIDASTSASSALVKHVKYSEMSFEKVAFNDFALSTGEMT